MKLTRLAIAPVLALALLSGCGDGSGSTAKRKRVVLKVGVYHSGEILVGGIETRLADLDARMAALPRGNGVVWLYREMKRSAPPPESVEILNLALKNGVPMRMAGNEDFSDLE